MRLQTLLAPAALGVLAAASQASDVGAPLPSEVELDDFAQTGAKSLDDLFGRTVLLEFFAYW